jgi:hypothetical protein
MFKFLFKCFSLPEKEKENKNEIKNENEIEIKIKIPKRLTSKQKRRLKRRNQIFALESLKNVM